jgi:hypothetical protein
MVVNVLVHIESFENVKRVAEVYLPRNSGITSEDWNKVHGTDDRINVNDAHDPIPVVVKVRLDNPHAGVWVRIIKRFAEVVDKCARKNLIACPEREKEMDPCNVQASHPRGVDSGVKDDAVLSEGNDFTCLPTWGTSDCFAVEAADAGSITWCAKGGGCRVED